MVLISTPIDQAQEKNNLNIENTAIKIDNQQA